MKKILFATMSILIASLFLTMSACKKDTAPNTTAPAGDATRTAEFKDCNAYCAKQAHADCVGTWTISGTLPSCTCDYKCTEETTAPDTTKTASDNTKVYSDDGNFYLHVEDNPVDAGYVKYFAGNDNEPADRIEVCGDGIKDVKEAQIWIKIGTNPAKIKGLLHEAADNCRDFTLKSGDRGVISFKFTDASGNDISTAGMTVGIIPDILQ